MLLKDAGVRSALTLLLLLSAVTVLGSLNFDNADHREQMRIKASQKPGEGGRQGGAGSIQELRRLEDVGKKAPALRAFAEARGQVKMGAKLIRSDWSRSKSEVALRNIDVSNMDLLKSGVAGRVDLRWNTEVKPRSLMVVALDRSHSGKLSARHPTYLADCWLTDFAEKSACRLDLVEKQQRFTIWVPHAGLRQVLAVSAAWEVDEKRGFKIHQATWIVG